MANFLSKLRITTYNYNKTRAPHAVLTLICHGPTFYLKFLVKRGDNSKIRAIIVMSLALQLHIVMSMYSKSDVDTLNTFFE